MNNEDIIRKDGKKTPIILSGKTYSDVESMIRDLCDDPEAILSIMAEQIKQSKENVDES